jgi:hypothetical protein
MEPAEIDISLGFTNVAGISRFKPLESEPVMTAIPRTGVTVLKP